ncbi:MAG: hypothetical protein RLZZ377_497, partial [Chloroflexota bacterium]
MTQAREIGDAPAPLLQHLKELRRRVAVALAAVIVGAAITFAWADTLIALLRTPLDDTPLFF